MASKEISAKQFVTSLNKVLEDFDDGSVEELQFYSEILKTKQSQLRREQEFLKMKYGENDERVSVVASRLINDELVIKAMDARITLAKVKPVSFTGTGACVHGIVYGRDGMPVAGKKVVLFHAAKDAVKGVAPGVSGENGYYAVLLTEEQAEAVKDEELALAVAIRGEGNVIVQKSVRVTAGKMEYIDLQLPV